MGSQFADGEGSPGKGTDGVHGISVAPAERACLRTEALCFSMDARINCAAEAVGGAAFSAGSAGVGAVCASATDATKTHIHLIDSHIG